MHKAQFMKKLERGLRSLSPGVRREILQDFEEHFAIGAEQGKTEEEIAGSPMQIAKELRAVHYLEKAESASTAGNILRAAWAAIGLGFFNLVIVAGPFLALASCVIAGWITGVFFVVSPVLAVIELFRFMDAYAVAQMSGSLILSGVGLILLAGMWHLTRWLLKGFVKYLRYNVRLVKGGLKHDDE